MARLLMVVWLLATGVVQLQADDDSARRVSVTGTAITRVQPDLVVWNVVARRTNQDLAEAQADCDAIVKRILALRAEEKLKPEDVQTGYLSIQKIYDRDQAGNVTSFKHYEVVRTITLRQRDTSRFDEVLAKLVATNNVEVSYQLESSDYHKLRVQTRLDAVRVAREKAAAMTELLGATLGRVVRISEPKTGGDTSFSNYRSNSVSVAPRDAEADEEPGTFAPGAIEVRVSIDVEFEIE